jgi:hypothetical protein
VAVRVTEEHSVNARKDESVHDGQVQDGERSNTVKAGQDFGFTRFIVGQKAGRDVGNVA